MIFIKKLKMSFRITMTELERPIISLSSAVEHRHLDCFRYDKCLDRAIKKNWKSFSCSRCAVFKAYLKEKKELEEELKYSIRGAIYYEEGYA